MKVEDIIAISSSAGTVKAGLNSFKSLFERCSSLKQELDVTDSDIEVIGSCIEIMGKIYTNVREKIKESE